MSVYQMPIRIYYEDTDAGGIVFYANYLKFFERARTEWLRDKGIEQQSWLEQKIGFVVRRSNVDYLAAARFNDILQVSCEVIKITKTSITMMQEAINETGTVVCRAEVLIACVDLEKMKPIRIPEPMYKAITSES